MPAPSSPDQKSLVGYMIGKCKLLRICGRGAMGTVYKGSHSGLDIDVAVKILPPHLANNSNLVERFLREARLAARLNHANTVRVYDVGEESGYYYLVMEFIDGTDALELVRKHGPVEAAVVADIGAGAARALASAHANNVIHRDIKPANLMLPNTGGVKVADFGLARALASESGLTMTGAIMGTPDYMAPEQAQGVAVGPKADVYSLGATLYHLFVGRPPFSGTTPMAVALQHVTSRIVVPEDRVKDEAGQRLTRIIHEMTQKDHEKRPGDLDAIALKLAQVARMNRRTSKLLYEGATIFATTGFKIDADSINKQKEQEAEAAIDKGRVESPHLAALRKAADKARTSSPALPSLGPGALPPMAAPAGPKSAPQIPPELAELTQDMVREAKARARRSSGEVKAVPRDGDSGVRRGATTSNPEMSPHRDTRPTTSSSRRSKVVQKPEMPNDQEWESYAAKSFPTFQKNNILDGSASGIAAKEQTSSWDGKSGSSQANASKPDYSRPAAYEAQPTVLSSRTRGGGAKSLLAVLAVLAVAGTALWYFVLREDEAPANPGTNPSGMIELQASMWQAHPGGAPVIAACPGAAPSTFYTASEDGKIRRWSSARPVPAAEAQLDGVLVTAIALRYDGQRLAVATAKGEVILLHGETLQVSTPSAARFPGITALAFAQAVLLIGDAQGMLHRGDGKGSIKIDDAGKPVSSVRVRGEEIWATAGTSVKRVTLEGTGFGEITVMKNLPLPVLDSSNAGGRNFAMVPGKVMWLSTQGLDPPEYECTQPVMAATTGGLHLVVVGKPGICFLNPATLEVQGFTPLPADDRLRAMIAVPGEQGVVIGTEKGNLIYCNRK